MEIIVLSSSCSQWENACTLKGPLLLLLLLKLAVKVATNARFSQHREKCVVMWDRKSGHSWFSERQRPTWALMSKTFLGEIPMWKNGDIAGQSGEIDQIDQCLICSEREKEELSGGCALDSGVMEEGSTRLPGSVRVKVGFQRTSVSSRNGLALVLPSHSVMGS